MREPMRPLLSDEDRARILARLRADRIRRGGDPEPDMDRARRSAEACMRMARE